MSELAASGAWAMGADRVIALVGQRAPASFARIEDVPSDEELEEMSRGTTRRIGTDVEELDASPAEHCIGM